MFSPPEFSTPLCRSLNLLVMEQGTEQIKNRPSELRPDLGVHIFMTTAVRTHVGTGHSHGNFHEGLTHIRSTFVDIFVHICANALVRN